MKPKIVTLVAEWPEYMTDLNYFPKSDPRREGHRARIRLGQRIEACLLGGDGSYAVVVTREDVLK